MMENGRGSRIVEQLNQIAWEMESGGVARAYAS